MKKKLVLIVLSLTVILAILIFYAIDNSKRLYDESKPNIFEIPGTASHYVGNYNTYYDFYFMIQKTKYTEIGIRNMIENFVMENYDLVTNVLDVDITENPSVYFHFMKPSRQFPVYFEENKSYFKMDDYVTHYIKTNEVVFVKFTKQNVKGEYTFNYDLL